MLEATFDKDDPAKAGSLALTVIEGPVTRCTPTTAYSGDGVTVTPIEPGSSGGTGTSARPKSP